jgi:undecaprenyl-diphosphatase
MRPNSLACLLLLVAALGVFFFFKLASEVQEKELLRFDQTLLLSMREKGDINNPLGSPRVEDMARDVTSLGSFTILTLVTVIGVAAALFAGRWRLALAAFVSVFSGMAVLNLLKSGFNRPRPDLVKHAAFVYDASFPSGHSTMSAIIYLTLGIILAQSQPRKGVKIFAVTLSILITTLVGISRVYLGVHGPTVVIAGWALGRVWAVVFWFATVWIKGARKRRGS